MSEAENVNLEGSETDSDASAATSSKKEEDDNADKYPSGEFEFREFGAWKRFTVKCKMLFSFPWERVRKGSVLSMKLRGQVQLVLISVLLQSIRKDLLCLW